MRIIVRRIRYCVQAAELANWLEHLGGTVFAVNPLPARFGKRPKGGFHYEVWAKLPDAWTEKRIEDIDNKVEELNGP